MASVNETVIDTLDDHPDLRDRAADGDDDALNRLTGHVMSARGIGGEMARQAIRTALDLDDASDHRAGVDIEGFRERLENLAARGDRSPDTVTGYASSVEKFRDWYHEFRTPGAAPTPEDVRAWLDYMRDEEGLAGSTIHRHYYALEAYFRYLGRRGDLIHISETLSDDYPKSSDQREPLPWDDVLALREAAEDARDRAIIQVLTGFGVRVGELVALDTDDVQPGKRRLLVRREKRRNQRTDVLYLTDEDCEVFERYLDARPDYAPDDAERGREEAITSDALFINNRNRGSGWRIGDAHVRSVVDRVAEDAGVDANVFPHRLRHSVGTKLAREGFTEYQVKQYLGHSREGATERYMSMAEETYREMREAIA